AYLSKALKYKILNEFRSDNTRNTYQRTLSANVTIVDFAGEVEAKDLRKRVNNILESLPEKCKKVFLLSRKENCTNKDISMHLEISVSTVEKHIGKALKTLRSGLPEYALAR